MDDRRHKSGDDRLRQELERLRRRVRMLRREQPASGASYLIARLMEETSRSRRYNHFFSVLWCRSTSADTEEVLRRVCATTRTTDIVGLLDADESVGLPPDAAAGILAIMPETDSDGARVAASRLRADMPNLRDLRVGSATFPQDATSSHELLRAAVTAA